MLLRFFSGRCSKEGKLVMLSLLLVIFYEEEAVDRTILLRNITSKRKWKYRETAKKIFLFF